MIDLSEQKPDKIKHEKLEKLIEQKINEKTREKNQKINKLEKEIEKLKHNSNTDQKSSTTQSSKKIISRRDFLKKAGLGTAGLAALMSPVSALDIKDSSGLNVYSDGVQNFEVSSNGNVNISNGVLNIQGNRAATRDWANSNLVSTVNGETGEVTVDAVTDYNQLENTPTTTNTVSQDVGYDSRYTFSKGISMPGGSTQTRTYDPGWDEILIDGFQYQMTSEPEDRWISLVLYDKNGDEIRTYTDLDTSNSSAQSGTLTVEASYIYEIEITLSDQSGYGGNPSISIVPHRLVLPPHQHSI